MRFTQECTDKLDLDPTKWLWPEELKLICWLVLVHETTFIWELGKHGQFKEEYFPPIKIAMVPHMPWVQRNIPIPPTIFNDVINIIKGFANSAQIFQADTLFILQHEIPHHTIPFIDDLPVKSVTSCYQSKDGSYETIPENPGIRRFIWEHSIVIHRILQRLENVGATVSATKFVLAAPMAVILGYKCTIDGHIPEELKMQKIQDWPEPKNATHKDEPFVFGDEHQESMKLLKEAVVNSPALCCIDYESGCEIILAVDTSLIVVGFILMQIDILEWMDSQGDLPLVMIRSKMTNHKDWLDEAYSFAIALMNQNPSSVRDHAPFMYCIIIQLFACDRNISPSVCQNGNKSIDEEDVPPIIPQSDAAITYDNCMERIHTFLTTQICPDDLSNSEFQKFVNEATYLIQVQCAMSSYPKCEQRHYDVWEAIMKSSEGEENHWFKFVHTVFWAEWVTILKSCGLSPFFIVHGIEPLFPFDLTKATFLVPFPNQDEFSSTDLITWHARQLQKHIDDLQDMEEKVVKASSYLLAELDGAVSCLHYATFQLIPYHLQSKMCIPVTSITELDDDYLARLATEGEDEQEDE
ncbi:hypothetical protein K503DRAFT_785886 [Rhizopogon vinicolor AM-OR11-026]|uniref:Uncharacterized protein n=1 Tax=Rhizopogon vinicolor AM-OR11-026 TaxID=1314800 RepID=A0A1B7MNW0_9AGAM|nr:hypothetical protein K503DRAFT_785886 [Rhizopogon vinicolor AM-OR11-026]